MKIQKMKSWKKSKSRLLKHSASSCFFLIYIIHAPLLPILHVILTNYMLSNFHSSTYLSFRGSDMLFLFKHISAKKQSDHTFHSSLCSLSHNKSKCHCCINFAIRFDQAVFNKPPMVQQMGNHTVLLHWV